MTIVKESAAFDAGELRHALTALARAQSDRTKLRADPPTTLAVRCTDVDASWLLRLDTEGVTAVPTTKRDGIGADSSPGHPDNVACLTSGAARSLGPDA